MNLSLSSADLPLGGIRVLDLSRLLPGPYCSLVLSDLGADVVKIEDPDGGDYLRYMPPITNGVGAMFSALNRGKRSIVLSLKTDVGRKAFFRLVETADVVLETFRPGVMDRLGCGHAVVSKHNPKVVYCSITGYGQEGPYAGRAGHDINYIALAGLLGQNGPRLGDPAVPNFQAADIAGGAWVAATRIIAALFARQAGVPGGVIDVSMTEGVASLLTAASAAVAAGAPEPERGDDTLSGGRACYATYRTKDGGYMALGALEPKFWKEFCKVVGRREWETRQFETGESGIRLKAEVAGLFAERTRGEWEKIFEPVDVCCEPVLTLGETARHPAVNRARWADCGKNGEYTRQWVNTPVAPGGRVMREQSAPALGQHTREILFEAGFTEEEIVSLTGG